MRKIVTFTLALTLSVSSVFAADIAPRTQTNASRAELGTHLIPTAEASAYAVAPTESTVFSVWNLLALTILTGTLGTLALRRFIRNEQFLHTQKLF